METEQIAETVDTATQPQKVQGAPAAAGKAQEKIDVNRVLDDEAYAEQVLGGLTNPQEEPAEQGDVAAAQDKGTEETEDERTIILRSPDGTEERVPISQVQNRWQQAGHLQTKYERLVRQIRTRPDLAHALEEDAAGKPERLNALLARQAAEEAAEPGEVDPAVFAEARKDPRLKAYTDDELKEYLQSISAFEAARTRATARKEQESSAVENVEVQRNIQAHLRAAIALEPSEEDARATLEFAGRQILEADAAAEAGTLKDDKGRAIPKEEWAGIKAALNDPRHPENFLRFFKAMSERRREQATSRPAAAPAPAPRPRFNTRVAPGVAAVTAPGRAAAILPSLEGKSGEEKRSIIDQLLDS